MKKLVFVLIFLLYTTVMFSQWHCVSDYRRAYLYNKTINEYELLVSEDVPVLFTFQKNTVTEKNPSKEEVYFIEETEELPEGYKFWIVTENGNKFTLIIDTRLNQLKMSGGDLLLIYNIKNSW